MKSVGTKNAAHTPASSDADRIEEPTNRISYESIKEGIKANSGPLN